MTFNNSIEDAIGIYFGSEGEFLGEEMSPYMYNLNEYGPPSYFPFFCLNKLGLKNGELIYIKPPQQIIDFINSVWEYWDRDVGENMQTGYPGIVGIRKSGENTILFALHVINTQKYNASDATSVYGIKNKWGSVIPLMANADSPNNNIAYTPFFNSNSTQQGVTTVFAEHRLTWAVIDINGNLKLNTATFISGYDQYNDRLFEFFNPTGNFYINVSLGSIHVLHFFDSGLAGQVEAQSPVGPSGTNVVNPPEPILGKNYVNPVPLNAGCFGASIVNGTSFELFTGQALFPSQFVLNNNVVSISPLPEITENPAFFMLTLSSSNALFNRNKSFSSSIFTPAPLRDFVASTVNTYLGVEPNAALVIHSGNIQKAPMAKGLSYIEKSSFDLANTFIDNPYVSIMAEIRESLYERLSDVIYPINTSECNQNVFFDPSGKLITASDKNAELFLDIVQFEQQSATMPAPGSIYPVTEFKIVTDQSGQQTSATPLQPFSYSDLDAWACSVEIVNLRNILVGSVPIIKTMGIRQSDGSTGFPIQSDDKGYTYILSCAQDLFVSDARAQKIIGGFLSSYSPGSFLPSEQSYKMTGTQPMLQEQMTGTTAGSWPTSAGYSVFPSPLLSPFYLNFFVNGNNSAFPVDFYYRPFFSFDEDKTRYGFSITDLVMPYLLNGKITNGPRIYEKINTAVRQTIATVTPGAYMVSGKYAPQALKISKGPN